MKDILISENAYLVHCSSYAPMVQTYVGDPKGHLEKLSYALRKNADFPISCSTLIPRDSFENYAITGKIGLIVCPESIDQVLAAEPIDNGSDGEPAKSNLITREKIVAAIKNRSIGDHNEILLSSFQVYGLFFCLPIQFRGTNGITIKSYSDEDIYEAFGPIPYYRSHEGLMFKTEYDMLRKCFRTISACDYASPKDIYNEAAISPASLTSNIATTP
jgi:hypothetical protein